MTDEVDAAETSAYAYTPPAKPNRKLGGWALALGLVTPVIALLAFGAFAALFGAAAIDDPWTLLALIILGYFTIAALGLVAGVIAIVLGSLAVRRNRGRGLGIAGIVLGGISVLLSVAPVVVPWISANLGA